MRWKRRRCLTSWMEERKGDLKLANNRLEEYKSQITLFDLGLERNPGERM